MLGRLKKKKKKKKKMEKIAVFPFSVDNSSGVFEAICECYWVHSDSYTIVRYLKRLKSSRLGRVQAFPMYGGLDMSAPSLHRESTNSLIFIYTVMIWTALLLTCVMRQSVILIQLTN